MEVNTLKRPTIDSLKFRYDYYKKAIFDKNVKYGNGMPYWGNDYYSGMIQGLGYALGYEFADIQDEIDALLADVENSTLHTA